MLVRLHSVPNCEAFLRLSHNIGEQVFFLLTFGPNVSNGGDHCALAVLVVWSGARIIVTHDHLILTYRILGKAELLRIEFPLALVAVF